MASPYRDAGEMSVGCTMLRQNWEKIVNEEEETFWKTRLLEDMIRRHVEVWAQSTRDKVDVARCLRKAIFAIECSQQKEHADSREQVKNAIAAEGKTMLTHHCCAHQ